LNIKLRDMAATQVKFGHLGLTGKGSGVVSAGNEYLDQNTTLFVEIAEKGLGFSKKKLDLDKNQLLRRF